MNKLLFAIFLSLFSVCGPFLSYADSITFSAYVDIPIPDTIINQEVAPLHKDIAIIGGKGATCNPATSGWPTCDLAVVPVRQNVTNKTYIPAGHYATPYVANTANTEYILEGDITADSTAITITASYVVININGHTITYNQKSPGEGVNIGGWNKNHIAIVNGSIIQGAALSEGDEYGRGNNPISTYNSSQSTLYGSSNLHVANVYVRYGGQDVGGIICAGADGLYEQNYIEDTYEFGTLKNRHQGIDALTGSQNTRTTTNIIYRNNTIINSRHRGITTGNGATVYDNHITTRSIATNAVGISSFDGNNIQVYNNTVIARGEHAIGIGFGSPGTENIKIYNNSIDSQTTALGVEYGGTGEPSPTTVYKGNEAVGFRSTWGGNNIHFYNNEIVVRSSADYLGTFSLTGSKVHIKSEARGLMVMLLTGQTALYENNIITALDEDGNSTAKGITVTGYDYDKNGNNAGLVFRGNTVTSNSMNVALSDAYGAAPGWPLFTQNTFIKANNFPNYATIGCGLGGYYVGTGKFVSNTYQDGAAENSLLMYFGNHNTETNPWKSIMFGRLLTATVKDDSGVPKANTTLICHYENGDTRINPVTAPLNTQFPLSGAPENTQAVTNENGQAIVILYDYELNDIGTAHGSTDINKVEFKPGSIEIDGVLMKNPLLPTQSTLPAPTWR